MGIRLATDQDQTKIVEILDEAFREDPVVTYTNATPGYPGFLFAEFLPHFIKHNKTYISDDGKGVALWLPPNKEVPNSAAIKLIFKILRKYKFSSVVRSIKVLIDIDKYHYKPEHYYLFAIGTTGSGRGHGIGSALMREVTRKCDREEMPAYLENTNEKNAQFYLKYGFRTMRTLHFKNGPKIWCMLRKPQEISTEEKS